MFLANADPTICAPKCSLYGKTQCFAQLCPYRVLSNNCTSKLDICGQIVSRFACPADPALRSAMFCAVISGGASEAIGLFRFVVLLIPFLLQNGAMEKNDSG